MVSDDSRSSSCKTSEKVLKSYLFNEGNGNQYIFPKQLAVQRRCIYKCFNFQFQMFDVCLAMLYTQAMNLFLQVYRTVLEVDKRNT